MTDSIQIQKSEYDAILRQAVAVIDKALAKEYASPCLYVPNSTKNFQIIRLRMN